MKGDARLSGSDRNTSSAARGRGDRIKEKKRSWMEIRDEKGKSRTCRAAGGGTKQNKSGIRKAKDKELPVESWIRSHKSDEIEQCGS